MTCDTAGQLISRALDEDLSAGEKELMHTHLAECATCRHDFAEMKLLKIHLKQRLGGAPAPSYLWSSVSAQLLESPRPPAQSVIPTKYAAGIVALAVGLVTFRVWQNWTPTPDLLSEERIALVSKLHERKQCGTLRPVGEPAEAAAWLTSQVGYAVPAYDFRPAKMRLIAAGVCGCIGRSRAPLFVWERDGKPLWLFVLPSEDYLFGCGDSPDCHWPKTANVRGIRVAGFATGRYLLCIMSRQSDREFVAFASSLPELLTPTRR